MSTFRARFIGGPLSGQAVWIEEHCTSLNVQVAGEGHGLKRTLEYRRDGLMLTFVGEAQPEAGVISPSHSLGVSNARND